MGDREKGEWFKKRKKKRKKKEKKKKHTQHSLREKCP
jgi:hypothetical protein